MTLSPPYCRSPRKSAAHRHSIPQAGASYAYRPSGHEDAVVYGGYTAVQSQTPVIPAFSDQRCPPADSMLFGGGSAASISLGPRHRSNPSAHPTRSPQSSQSGSSASTFSCSSDGHLQALHQAQHHSMHSADDTLQLERQQHPRPRWQCAPTPEYRPVELSQPLHEVPLLTYTYQQDDDEYDFEKNGPPATPVYVGSSLPRTEPENCSSSSYGWASGEHYQCAMDTDMDVEVSPNTTAPMRNEQSFSYPREAYSSGRVIPGLQLPSPAPSPCSQIKPLSVSSETSHGRYISADVQRRSGR